MRPISSKRRWIAAAVCMLATSGFAAAEEGVVRISDAGSRPGVVRMGGSAATVQQTSWGMPANGIPAQSAGYVQQMYGNAQMDPYHMAGYAMGSYCGADGCPGDCMSGGYCDSTCYPSDCCDTCETCDTGCCTDGCNSCDNCWSYAPGHRQRVLTLFARATPKGSCNNGRYGKRWWRGQQMNYHARNQRLANCLFGWMVPSGCCNQGCPPVGKYHITYADQPGYAHPADSGVAYGAQGYGVPVTVPLAPNVRQSYNYSWGTPASRITQLGNYDPSASPQPLYRQCW